MNLKESLMLGSSLAILSLIPIGMGLATIYNNSALTNPMQTLFIGIAASNLFIICAILEIPPFRRKKNKDSRKMRVWGKVVSKPAKPKPSLSYSIL